MSVHNDWLRKQQHQHHPACSPLALALAFNWPVSAILPVDSSINHLLSDDMEATAACHAVSPLTAAASRAAVLKHASEISRNSEEPNFPRL